MASEENKSFQWWEGDEDSEQVASLLARLEIVSRRQVESLFAGSYRSAFLGRGMDFAEVRPYQPGDEIRWIDWNVSARMDDVYVKQFTEERERTVFLVWDTSESMDLGSHWRSKRELGAELAMILGMSALANQDRVGLLVFGDKVERFVQPQRGRKQMMRMIQEILAPRPSRGDESPKNDDTQTHRESALMFLQRVAPRHSIVFFLSDFLAPLDIHTWQRLARRCEVIPVVLRDPSEKKLPDREIASHQVFSWFPTWVMAGVMLLALLWGLGQGGAWLWGSAVATSLFALGTLFYASLGRDAMVRIHDLETKESVAVDLRRCKDDVRGYQLPLSPSTNEICEEFQKLSLDVVALQTDKDPVDTLRVFFRQRQRMSGRNGRVSSS